MIRRPLAVVLSLLLLTPAAACGPGEDPMPPPKPCAMWPVIVTTGLNDSIDVVNESDSRWSVAYLAATTYYSPADLAAAVQAALAGLFEGATTFVVTVNEAGHLIFSGSRTFRLKFGTPLDPARSAHYLLGFDAVDTGFASTITAPHQLQSCWYGDDPVSEDSLDRPVQILRAQTRALSGKVRTRTFATPYERFIALAFLEPHKVFVSEEGTAHVNEALERLFVSGAERFRWFPDASDPATYADYALDAGTKFDPRRLSPGAALYTQSMRLLRWVG